MVQTGESQEEEREEEESESAEATPSEAETQEEAGFYMAVADYFLQHKQRELIAQGAY